MRDHHSTCNQHTPRTLIHGCVIAFLLAFTCLGTLAVPAPQALAKETAAQAADTLTAYPSNATEMRGLWIGFPDFKTLGLKDASKARFTKSIRRVLKRAKRYGCNTVFWHARAFDDATWKSETFKACDRLTSRASGRRTAARTYRYDPLRIVVAECHRRKMSVHAWMNPYRITYSRFLDPASKRSTYRIKRAIKELRSYGLDGIHFDDYFYSSTGSYVTPSRSTVYARTVRGRETGGARTGKARRTHVNRMVRSVHSFVHRTDGWLFGISPAGNYDNCMNEGADVRTWLSVSKRTYVDYLVPQIYWTDNYGSSGKTRMYTDRLAVFEQLNERGTPLYIGLALYQAGRNLSTDRGWKRRSTNLKRMVKKLRASGIGGYVLYAASDLFRRSAQPELTNLATLVS